MNEAYNRIPYVPFWYDDIDIEKPKYADYFSKKALGFSYLIYVDLLEAASH